MIDSCGTVHLLRRHTRLQPVLNSAGTPCNGLSGYCDVFSRCRGVDPDTPLSLIKQCFEKGDCITLFVEFLSVRLCTKHGLNYIAAIVLFKIYLP